MLRSFLNYVLYHSTLQHHTTMAWRGFEDPRPHPSAILQSWIFKPRTYLLKLKPKQINFQTKSLNKLQCLCSRSIHIVSRILNLDDVYKTHERLVCELMEFINCRVSWIPGVYPELMLSVKQMVRLASKILFAWICCVSGCSKTHEYLGGPAP